MGDKERWWKGPLTAASSKVNRLNLLCGALEFTINEADRYLGDVESPSASI